jgi:hypothetical protein
LEKLIQQSDARRGWSGDPIATIDRLTKSIIAIDEPEMTVILEELGVLDQEAEELIPVS